MAETNNNAMCKLHTGIQANLDNMKENMETHHERLLTVEKRSRATLNTLVITLIAVIANLVVILAK